MATQKKAGHTPGPWTFGKFTVGPRVVIEDPVSGHPIAEVINWDPATMEPEEQWYSGHPKYAGGRIACPNARLIAAAPDLLAALRLAEEMLDQAADALESHGEESTRGLVRSASIEARAAIAKATGEKPA